jgi:uncharacterized SAM-binding protein YcdF (DUF218 family)
MTPRRRNRLRLAIGLGALAAIALIGINYSGNLLGMIGRFIVQDQAAAASDAVVVLYTGTEYYPRLIQAAQLYREGLAAKVVINGNRKTDTLRLLEAKGFQACCAWYDDYVRILALYGVPPGDVIPIGAEDVYDTITEAAAVGPRLVERGLRRILITTSKYHTRRAAHIWKRMFAPDLSIRMIAAKDDPFDPDRWWRDGRQIKWVLAEYGAWVYYGWQRLRTVEYKARLN